MPLIESDSQKAKAKNIAQLISDGFPPAQAVAIANDIQEKARKKRKS